MIAEIIPSGISLRALTPPISKSDAIRALAVAHVFGLTPPSLGKDEDLPDDVRHFAAGLGALRRHSTDAIDCGDGGAPFRFLLALAAATPGARVRFTGSARLGERPHAALVNALREGFGATITVGAPWPVVVDSPSEPGPRRLLRVAAHESSQFASAVLLAAAYLSRAEQRVHTVELEGAVASAGYLALTEQWLRAAGARIVHEEARVLVDATRPPSPLPAIPADWSSAAYLLLIGWRLGVEVRGLDPNAAHPDRAIVRHLERARRAPHEGLDADVTETPDLAPTLAALACVLGAPSILRNVKILRAKESDRVEGIRALVTAFGADCRLEDDALLVSPIRHPPTHVDFDSRGDHRFAMSAATLSILSGVPLTLRGAEVVRKSFPGFFGQLGVDLR